MLNSLVKLSYNKDTLFSYAETLTFGGSIQEPVPTCANYSLDPASTAPAYVRLCKLHICIT